MNTQPEAQRAAPELGLSAEHLAVVRDFYDAAPVEPNWAGMSYRRILAHYYRDLIPAAASVLEIGCGSGTLLSCLANQDVTGVDLSAKQIEAARRRVPHGKFFVQSGEALDLDRTFDVVILSDTINLAADVQMILDKVRSVSNEDTRLVMNFFSALWRPLLGMARAAGVKAATPASNWLATADAVNLLALAGWEVVKIQPRVLCPVPLLGLEKLINRFAAPLLPWSCLTIFVTARLRPARSAAVRPSKCSVVIPARNEADNIEPAVRRTAYLPPDTELIFVEGHSTDNTWPEIQRVQKEYPQRAIKILQQSGKGKGNAVRDGFAAASGDILMILDADLTMPPEDLVKFRDVLVRGDAEFVNGCRLVYPMEERAMRFLNLCANKFFAVAFTWVLDQPIKDTLCGTKVIYRKHYDRIAANRAFFGEFDPFGDFDLLFGADKLNLKIVDVPIRYRERTYGETNIHRWSHGLLLLRMLFFAARKLKFT